MHGSCVSEKNSMVAEIGVKLEALFKTSRWAMARRQLINVFRRNTA